MPLLDDSDLRCPRCDKVRATDVDRERSCHDPCGHCVALCWGDYSGACEAVDWRARSRDLEVQVRQAKALAQEAAIHATYTGFLAGITVAAGIVKDSVTKREILLEGREYRKHCLPIFENIERASKEKQSP